MRYIWMLLPALVFLMPAPAGAEVRSAPAEQGSRGMAGGDDALRAEYAEAIRNRVLAHWTLPASVTAGTQCQVVVQQILGGDVYTARVTDECPYDEVGKRSLEAAVLKAAPFPYRGYEKVFSRSLVLTMTAPDR